MAELDNEEKELLELFETGQLKPIPDLEDAKKAAKAAAGNFFKKNSRINIRISDFDLVLLKRKAAEEGLPYQTLLSSLIHKYVTGRLN